MKNFKKALNLKFAEVEKLLAQKFTVQVMGNQSVLNSIEVGNIYENLGSEDPSDGKSKSICLYRLHDNQKALQQFTDRLKSTVNKSPIVIVICAGAVDLQLELKDSVVVHVKSKDFLAVTKALVDMIYPMPKDIKIAGVTGTNGKTTTVNIAMELATRLGHPAVSIGTIGVNTTKGQIDFGFGTTTPSYLVLRKIFFHLSEMYKTYFIEVSSHALVQDRLYDIKLEVAAWTSFSQDHLDYHSTMDEYFNAKMQVFACTKGSVFVPVTQTDLLEKIKKHKEVALSKPNISYEKLGLFFGPLYNRENLGLAISLNEFLFNVKVEQKQVENLPLPRGRFYPLEKNGHAAIIDYAHTPDAVLNVINAVKNSVPNKKIVTIVGCGGDRDKTKRPLMAKMAIENSDYVYFTSDNPRTERPDAILDDMLNFSSPKLSSSNYKRIVDRRVAIEMAVEKLQKDQILLVLGKGHEEYQEINGVKNFFSDSLIVAECLEKKC